jgi:hypothetical protein
MLPVGCPECKHFTTYALFIAQLQGNKALIAHKESPVGAQERASNKEEGILDFFASKLRKIYCNYLNIII